jgi:hypothetical protein
MADDEYTFDPEEHPRDTRGRFTGPGALSNTTDASEWARECVHALFAASEPETRDELTGALLGWFANAIETGRAAGAAKERERLNAMIDAGTADGRDLVERLVAAKEERDGAEKDAADMAKRLGAMDSELHQAEVASKAAALEEERRRTRDLRAKVEMLLASEAVAVARVEKLRDEVADLRHDLGNETGRAERAEARVEKLLREPAAEDARKNRNTIEVIDIADEDEDTPDVAMARTIARGLREERAERAAENPAPVPPWLLGVYSGHLTVNAAWREQAVEVTLSGPMSTVEAVMAAAIDSLRSEAEK